MHSASNNILNRFAHSLSLLFPWIGIFVDKTSSFYRSFQMNQIENWKFIIETKYLMWAVRWKMAVPKEQYTKHLEYKEHVKINGENP